LGDTTSNTNNTLLTVNVEIRDLLRAKLGREAEAREKMEKVEDKKGEWRRGREEGRWKERVPPPLQSYFDHWEG